jgi:hypothetical protein
VLKTRALQRARTTEATTWGEIHLRPGASRGEFELRSSGHRRGTACARSSRQGTGAALRRQDPVGRTQARHKIDLWSRGGDDVEGARPPGDELWAGGSDPRASFGRAPGRWRAPSGQRILRRRDPELRWPPWEGPTVEEKAPLGGAHAEMANRRVGAPFSTRRRSGRRGDWGGGA